MNDVEKILLGTCAGIGGIGFQILLPASQRIDLTNRIGLIFLAFSIPIVYYVIKIEIICFKRIYEIFKNKTNKNI